MGAINGKITMSTCERRPCWVDGRRAIFHRWTDSARPVKPVSGDQDTDERLQKWSVHGLVEYEDGTMEREWPSKIRFADSTETFAAFNWDAMERQRDLTDNCEEGEPEPEKGPETDPVKAAQELLKKCESCKHKNRLFDNACLYCLGGDRYEPKGGAV